MEENSCKRKRSKLPSVGSKKWKSEGTETESDEINNILNEHKCLLKDTFVGNKTVLEAIWMPSLNCARVVKCVGKYLETFGHAVNGVIFLYPEETLFLVETNSLILQFNEQRLSRQECYRILLDEISTCTFAEYRTYRHLLINGFKLFRVCRSVNVAVSACEESDLREEVLRSLYHYISSLPIKNLNVFIEDKLVNISSKSNENGNTNRVALDDQISSRFMDEDNLISTEFSSLSSRLSVDNREECADKSLENAFNRFSDTSNVHKQEISCDGKMSILPLSSTIEHSDVGILTIGQCTGIISSTEHCDNLDIKLNNDVSFNQDEESKFTADHYSTTVTDPTDMSDLYCAATSANNSRSDSISTLRIYYKNDQLRIISGMNNDPNKANIEWKNVERITNLTRDYNQLILKLKSAASELEICNILKTADCNGYLNPEIKNLLIRNFSAVILKKGESKSSNFEKCLTASATIKPEDDVKPLLDRKNCLTYAETLKKLQIFQKIDYAIEVSRYFEKVKYDVYTTNTKFRKTNRPAPHYRLMIFEENEQLPSTVELNAVREKFNDKIPLLFAIVYPDKIALLRVDHVLTPMQLD